MRETSLYCRPDVVLYAWLASLVAGHVLIFGRDKHGSPLGPYPLAFLDSEHQLGMTTEGLAVLLPIETVISAPVGYTREFLSLLRAPRHVRKPTNFVDPDDCPELRALFRAPPSVVDALQAPEQRSQDWLQSEGQHSFNDELGGDTRYKKRGEK